MLLLEEAEVLRLFEKVHGPLSNRCSAEIIYDDAGGIAGVACCKNGVEVWRSTLSEIAIDIVAKGYSARRAGTELPENEQ